MEKYFDAIKQNPLFENIGFDEFQAMLDCVQGRVQNYSKSGVILLAGNPVETVGLVLSGKVQIVREDSDGKQNLLTELHQGELFAEVFACAGIERSPVTVLAASPAVVLHLNYRKVITTCPSSCTFHQRLIENMLALAAYLCVERSAMSAELSKMQKDGLIRYTRKDFALL